VSAASDVFDALFASLCEAVRHEDHESVIRIAGIIVSNTKSPGVRRSFEKRIAKAKALLLGSGR